MTYENSKIQWNSYKAETIGGKKSVRFMEMPTL